MEKIGFYMFAAALCMSQPLWAQERSAGGSAETQMTWSALSAKIANVDTKATGANVRIDQLVKCGKKEMLYAPGMAGADADGCIDTPLPKISCRQVTATQLTGPTYISTAT